MWNGIGWYGFIGVVTTSMTDISLGRGWHCETGLSTPVKYFY